MSFICIYVYILIKIKNIRKMTITFVNIRSNIFIETNVIQDKVRNLAEL